MEAVRQRINSCVEPARGGTKTFVLGVTDDDVDFVSYAPVDVFPCLGKQPGRAAVAASLKTIHNHLGF